MPVTDHPEPEVALLLIHQEELSRRGDTPWQFRELSYNRINVGVIECATPEPALRVLRASPGGRVLAHKIAKPANTFAPKPIASGCLGNQPFIECVQRLTVFDVDRQQDVADPTHEHIISDTMLRSRSDAANIRSQ